MNESLKHTVVVIVGIGSTILCSMDKINSESLMLIYGNIMMYVFKNGNNAIKKHKVDKP